MTRFLTARGLRLPGSPAVLASLAVLAAGLSACSGSPGGSGGGQPAPVVTPSTSASPGGTGTARSLSWHACTKGHARLQCAMLTVPLDYAHPGGRTIQLALDEIPATAPAGQQLGPLLVNPGGPGGAGLDLPQELKPDLPASVASRYDIIGFDPRGVGLSRPQLSCDPSFFSGVRPPYQPATKAAEQVQVNKARAYAADCEQKFGWLLPHMSTADNARDMDAIRAALGVPKISYYGISWGTYLGQVYGTLFPGHIRRMVLDSTVDPTGWWYQDGFPQADALQARLVAFFSWIASHNAVYRLGSTEAQVAARYNDAIRALAAHPIRGQGGPPVGGDELSDTVLTAAYTDSLWAPLATGLAEYENGHQTAELAFLYKNLATKENEFAVFNAVNSDDQASPNWATVEADTRRIDRTAPLLAWGGLWFSAPAAFWAVHSPAHAMKTGAPGLPGILMLQGSLDGATPLSGALAARRTLPTARMVEVKGGGDHGQGLTNPPNPCVIGYLARYLTTGALPAGSGQVSATCPAMPLPAPQT